MGDGDGDGEGGEEVDSDDERAKALKVEQAAVKQRNLAEFGGEDGDEEARLRYEGFRQGLYVRMLVRNVPVEFMRNFRPELPVIIGGLLSHEQQSVSMGYISARVKRHRWHKRILKSNDPLIFSVGWRRFQVRSPFRQFIAKACSPNAVFSFAFLHPSSPFPCTPSVTTTSERDT